MTLSAPPVTAHGWPDPKTNKTIRDLTDQNLTKGETKFTQHKDSKEVSG
jgi:hypothetical protein